MRRRFFNNTSVILLLLALILLIVPGISKQIIQGDINDKIIQFDNAVTNTPKSDSVDNETGGNTTADSPNSPSDDLYSADTVTIPIDVNRLYEDSVAYNNALADRQDMTDGFTDSVLDLTNYGIYDGMYGYLSCDSIGLYLPIYLGATDENMSYGAAHMSNTSLPVGGDNTHCVLVGHTGYFGRTFFDNIKYLEKGEILTVKTYFNTLTYKVVSYKEIGPTDTNDLFIQKEKDLLTLVTCSRLGTKRYMVQCERI